MITNKFSFSGALGKSQNLGGSMGFSIPHTIDVPPEYSFETDVPSVAEFLTSSLNGRLWLFRRSRRFYLAVLRWNVDTQRLVFVTSAILSNENFIRRGVDWILTDKSFILSSNDEPYFSISQYEADHTSYIDAVNQSYSFFPELETWEEIINGQILHVEGSPYDLWNNIPQNKLTPLEFHCYSDDNIQVITNFSPKLCYCNGLLYAKGMAHIGRVFLLPRSFNENGDIEDFYFYICPDYLRNYDAENKTFDDHDGWNNLILAPLNENSVCFFTPEDEDYGFCKKPVNSQVISLPQLEHLDFSQYNGAIFFDGLTLSNLLLNDSGASLLYDNIRYDCNGIRQWLAPAGFVKAINKNFLCDSNDTFSLITHLDSGFFREFISSQSLPFSLTSDTQKFFSMGHSSVNKKIYISVNEAPALYKNNQYALWDNFFKKCFHVSIVKAFQQENAVLLDSPPFVYINQSKTVRGYSVSKKITDETFTDEYAIDITDGSRIPIRSSRTYRLDFHEGRDFVNDIEESISYLDLDNGSFRNLEFYITLPRATTITYDFEGTMSYGVAGLVRYPCHFSDEHISYSESFASFPGPYICDNSIYYEVFINSYSHEVNLGSIYGELSESTSRYDQAAQFPDEGWRLLDDSVQCYLKLTAFNGQYLLFNEQRSNLKFFMNISQNLQNLGLYDVNYANTYNFYNLRDVLNDHNGKKYVLNCTHLCHFKRYYTSFFILLRSEYNPDIFNFDSELERSYSS